jgi:hypothetical protein
MWAVSHSLSGDGGGGTWLAIALLFRCTKTGQAAAPLFDF